MRATAVFHLHLTRPARHRVATATPHDSATVIFPERVLSPGSGFGSPPRDRRLQTAVYCRSDKDFAGETIRAQAHTRCIRDASETSKQLKRTSAERPIAVAASLCEARVDAKPMKGRTSPQRRRLQQAA